MLNTSLPADTRQFRLLVVPAIIALLMMLATTVVFAQDGIGQADCPANSTIIINVEVNDSGEISQEDEDALAELGLTAVVNTNGSVTLTNDSETDVYLVIKGGPDKAGGEAVLVPAGEEGTAFTPINPNNETNYGVSNFSICTAPTVTTTPTPTPTPTLTQPTPTPTETPVEVVPTQTPFSNTTGTTPDTALPFDASPLAPLAALVLLVSLVFIVATNVNSRRNRL